MRTGASASSSADVRMRAEEHPRAGASVGQQVGVLADPAQPGPSRQRALGQRPVVDVGHLAGRQPGGPQVGRERLEPVSQRNVVVGPKRVARDPTRRFRRRRSQHRRQGPARGRRDPGPMPLGLRHRMVPPPRPPSGPSDRGRRGRSRRWAVTAHPVHSAIRPAATLASIRRRSSGSGAASATPTSSRPCRAASSATLARISRPGGAPRRPAARRSARSRERAASTRAACGSRRPTRHHPRRSVPPRCGHRARR